MSQNLYSYCGNNPINYVDPTGHFAFTLVGAITGFVAGGLISGIGALVQGASIDDALQSAASGAVAGAFVGGATGLIVDTGGVAAIGYGYTAAMMGSARYVGGTLGNLAGQTVEHIQNGAEGAEIFQNYDYDEAVLEGVMSAASAMATSFTIPGAPQFSYSQPVVDYNRGFTSTGVQLPQLSKAELNMMAFGDGLEYDFEMSKLLFTNNGQSTIIGYSIITAGFKIVRELIESE